MPPVYDHPGDRPGSGGDQRYHDRVDGDVIRCKGAASVESHPAEQKHAAREECERNVLGVQVV